MEGADRQAKKTSDLGVRAASAVVMVAVSGTAFWLGAWWWSGFVALLALGVLREWIGLVSGFVPTPAKRGLWNAAGIVYIGFAAFTLAAWRQNETGTFIVLTIMGAVIATDVFAYFAGRTFGGPKIAPRISPSKTWSGLLGGALGASLLIVLAFYLDQRAHAGQAFNLIWPIALGVLVAVTAQAGDFFESWMKRRAGVKDSGALIPGHGGLFDRLDGLLGVLFVGGILVLARLMI